MERSVLIRRYFFFLLSLISFHAFGTSDTQKETHELLLTVNKNWVNLKNQIEHTFSPNSEQELIQLHLLNVVTFLEKQPINHLSIKQKRNRRLNILVLEKYLAAGDFPINTITPFRSPIFIDSCNVYCAVGYLMKESGHDNIAQEIAQEQLLSYLGDIEHPLLSAWQKSSGLSLFELALIQPTYTPPTPVCAIPSPINWAQIKTKNTRITKIFQGIKEGTIYAISPTDEFGLQQAIRYYNPKTKEWANLGSVIAGQILDLVFCNQQIYISVLLPNEKYPHQLLKLNGSSWEKIAHFNGSIQSISAFQNKLYVLGYFKKVNDKIAANFVVIEDKSIKPFNPVGLRNTNFDHLASSETALFLTSRGGIYKFKNDTINYVSSIQYFNYMPSITLDAIKDSLYVASLSIQGYNKYFDHKVQTSYLGNRLYGQDYPYSSVHFSNSKMIQGRMMISGDFKSSTLTPQINENRVLIECSESASSHWFGEGLIYQYGQNYYPILKSGIVMDFILLEDQIYILKKDGSISFTSLKTIEEKIFQFITGTTPSK